MHTFQIKIQRPQNQNVFNRNKIQEHESKLLELPSDFSSLLKSQLHFHPYFASVFTLRLNQNKKQQIAGNRLKCRLVISRLHVGEFKLCDRVSDFPIVSFSSVFALLRICFHHKSVEFGNSLNEISGEYFPALLSPLFALRNTKYTFHW